MSSNDRLNKIILAASAIGSLKKETRIGAITPKRVGVILDRLLSLIYGQDITTGGENAGDIEDDDTLLSDLINKVSVDTENMLLKYQESENEVYVCPVEMLSVPSAPSYSESTTITTVNNSKTINITNNTEGAVVLYCITSNGDEPDDPDRIENPSTGTGITLQGIQSSETMTYKIKAIAKYRGLFSATLNLTITTYRKVKTPSIEVPDTNEYDIARTVTLSCDTDDAAIYYTTDGTAPYYNDSEDKNGTLYTAPIPFSVNAKNMPATKSVKAIAVKGNWVSSEVKSETSIKLGAKRAYIGFSTKSMLERQADIEGLQQEIKGTTPSLNTLYTITQNTGGANGYIWICCVGEITPSKVFASADAVIDMGFESKGQVSGWNCYRIGNVVNETSTTLIIKS